MEKNNRRFRRIRHDLIFASLLYVKPELVDEWITFSLNNTDRTYNSRIIERSYYMMEKLAKGLSYDEAKLACDMEIRKIGEHEEDFVKKTIDFFYNDDPMTRPYCHDLMRYRKSLIR